MKRCPSCRSFVPARVCPECGATVTLRSRVPGWLTQALVGGSAVVTLAACYGVPIEDPPPDPLACTDSSTDFDGDGFCGDYDCDESDPDRHRDAVDPEGDGVDQNCDGVDGYFVGPDAGPTP